MSKNMIERVAKAVAEASHMPFETKICKRIAVAAIEAMKEPTCEMLDAGAYDLDMTLERQYKNMIEASHQCLWALKIACVRW